MDNNTGFDLAKGNDKTVEMIELIEIGTNPVTIRILPDFSIDNGKRKERVDWNNIVTYIYVSTKNFEELKKINDQKRVLMFILNLLEKNE